MTNLACLHFLCGKAGAGKSTLATDLAENHGAILISEDIWLARLFGDQMKTFDDYRSYSQRARSVVGPLVIDLLGAGQNVVMDYPANTQTSRAWFRSLYEAAGTAHVLHYVEASDETCLQRIAKRNIERPEGSHHVTPEVFAYVTSFFEVPQVADGFRLEIHTARKPQ